MIYDFPHDIRPDKPRLWSGDPFFVEIEAQVIDCFLVACKKLQK